MSDDERAREMEAEAFLASVTPKLMANAHSKGGLPVGQRTKVVVKQPQTSEDARITLTANLSKLQQREEARQNALQRIQATHCSVNSLEKAAQAQQQPPRAGGSSPGMTRVQPQQASRASNLNTVSTSPQLRPKSPTLAKPPPVNSQPTTAPPGSRSPTPAKPPPPPTLGTSAGKKQQVHSTATSSSSINGRPVSPSLSPFQSPASKTVSVPSTKTVPSPSTKTIPSPSKSPAAPVSTTPAVGIKTPPPARAVSPVVPRPNPPPASSSASVPKPPPVIKAPSPVSNSAAVKVDRSPSPTSQVCLDPVVSKPTNYPGRRFASPSGAVYSSVQKALESQIDDDLAQELAKSKAAEYFSSQQKAPVGAGKLGGQFKGALNEKLTGASTLCKTEEELLATIDKSGKPQLGRVLDDPSPASYKPQLGRVLDDAPKSSQPSKPPDNPPSTSQKMPASKVSPSFSAASHKPQLGRVIDVPPATHKPQLGKVVETSAPPPPQPPAIQPAPPPPPPATNAIPPPPIGGTSVPPPPPPSMGGAVPPPPPPSTGGAAPPPPPPPAGGAAAPPPPPPPPPPPVGYVPPKKPLSTQETAPRKTSPQPNRAAMIPGGASLQAELQKKLSNRLLANSNTNNNNNVRITLYKTSMGANKAVSDGPQMLARNRSADPEKQPLSSGPVSSSWDEQAHKRKLHIPEKSKQFNKETLMCTDYQGTVLPLNSVTANGKACHSQCFGSVDCVESGSPNSSNSH